MPRILMAAPKRQRRSTLATLLVAAPLFAFASGAVRAQDARVITDCPQPKLQSSAPVDDAKAAAQPQAYVVTCKVHAAEPATLQSVKATLKGRTEPLQTTYAPFDLRKDTLSAMFLLQIVEPARSRTAQQMADAVLKITESRDPNRRFAAYTFANDLTLLAGFDASKADFDKAVRGVRSTSLPTQLYQTALEAIEKLAKEPGTRKALVILGDGNSDDTGYTHEQVVAAAKQAGVTIHTLGFVEVASEMPRFQLLRRLAEDTGGFRRELRQARDGRFTVTPKFTPEVLENGGTLQINLREPPGTVTLAVQADLGGGKSETAEQALMLPTPAVKPPAIVQPPPPAWEEKAAAWIKDNRYISYALGLGFLLASLGFLLFAFGRKPPREANAKPKTTYGWLEMLDGNATQHPLQMTNVRIGRHSDNDVCLQNDSISRRHAVLHYDADSKRFKITDLGTENGVIVNKVRQTNHDLSDGDLIELGEVRLRFRANVESLGSKSKGS
jgi:hypothetical protein